MAREMTDTEKEIVAEFFRGDGPFSQDRHWMLTADDVRSQREHNNVHRPSYVGAQIHDLLTTCAFLMAENERLSAQREQLVLENQRLHGGSVEADTAVDDGEGDYDYIDGRNAERWGKRRTTCPHMDGSTASRNWLAGWDDRRRERLATKKGLTT